MPVFEICPDCYRKYFLFYSNLEIEVSTNKYKCHGCGQMKHTVKKVTADGKVVDIN